MDIDEDGLHAEFRSLEMLLVSGCMLEFFFFNLWHKFAFLMFCSPVCLKSNSAVKQLHVLVFR